MPIRIVLVDDHAGYRAAVRHMLAREPDLVVVGDAGDGAGAIEVDREQNPDVIVMDIEMSPLNGIELTRRIVARRPGAKVLALSLHGDLRFVEEMTRAGAQGYVLKQNATTELPLAIREVAAGRQYWSPNLPPSALPITGAAD